LPNEPEADAGGRGRGRPPAFPDDKLPIFVSEARRVGLIYARTDLGHRGQVDVAYRGRAFLWWAELDGNYRTAHDGKPPWWAETFDWFIHPRTKYSLLTELGRAPSQDAFFWTALLIATSKPDTKTGVKAIKLWLREDPLLLRERWLVEAHRIGIKKLRAAGLAGHEDPAK